MTKIKKPQIDLGLDNLQGLCGFATYKYKTASSLSSTVLEYLNECIFFVCQTQ